MSTWIPEDQRTPDWYIFNYQFMCRVPNIQTMSVDYIRHFGTPTSGSVTHDREMANELIIKMLTINQMVEFFKQGITVGIVNYKETKEIYERITDHLTAWKDVIAKSFHARGAPVEDLILLDKFAGAVYPHAVTQFTTEIVESILARRMAGTLKHTRSSILAQPKIRTVNPITEEEQKPQDAVNQYPERSSMASYFTGVDNVSIHGKWR